MGWQLSRKDNLYRIWSTFSDQYITDWISREEALAVWYDDTLMNFKKEVIRKYLLFPDFWFDHDAQWSIKDEVAHARYSQWWQELSEKQNEEEYCQFVDEMFEKIKAELEEKL